MQTIKNLFHTSDKHEDMGGIQTVVDYAFHSVVDNLDDAWIYLDNNYNLGEVIYNMGDIPDMVEGRRLSKPLPPPSVPLVGIEPNPGPDPPSSKQKSSPKQHMKKPPTKHAKASVPYTPKSSSVSPAVSAPLSSISGFTSRAPRIRRSNDRCVISHCELATLVSGTANFTASDVSIQPGLSTPFPWLSTQVNGWEKYRFRRLRAIYLTRCSASTDGTVVLAPDYDAADAAPENEVAATSFFGASDDAPWKTSYVDFDMRRSKELYVRRGPLNVNLDIKTYDFAKLWVCTSGGSGSWGKVFLDYEIELMNPQAVSASYIGGSVNYAGTMTPAAPIGTTATYNPGNIVSGVDATTISLDNLIVGQKYIITTNILGTGLTGITHTVANATSTQSIVNDLVNAAGTLIADELRFTAGSVEDSITIVATGTTVTGGYSQISAVDTVQ